MRFADQLQKIRQLLGMHILQYSVFIPLKKSDVNLNELIRDCFENERLLSIMHLINDDRESIGIGESQFINGVCWIGTIN